MMATSFGGPGAPSATSMATSMGGQGASGTTKDLPGTTGTQAGGNGPFGARARIGVQIGQLYFVPLAWLVGFLWFTFLLTLLTFYEHGNLFGAAMPICLERANDDGKLEDGSVVVLGGFSHAGDYAAAAAIRWREAA